MGRMLIDNRVPSPGKWAALAGDRAAQYATSSIYDGCLSVADYLCRPQAICGAAHINCEHYAEIWKNGCVVKKLLTESSRHVCRGRSELPAI
jgi:hypothetical protein